MNGKDYCYVAIVDDDDSVCKSLSRLLRTAGYQPITYPSAEAFLDDSSRPRFACLVLDIRLEGISGLELSRRLIAVNDNTPVIFITAQDDPDAQAEAEAIPCFGYFRKTDPGSWVLDAIHRGIHVADQPFPKPVASEAHA